MGNNVVFTFLYCRAGGDFKVKRGDTMPKAGVRPQVMVLEGKIVIKTSKSVWVGYSYKCYVGLEAG